jgi:tryptophan halogenase
MPNQKNVVIAGAGTAGLTTALIIKKTFPAYNVTVVYSKEVGIIGVGEGSTEHWRWFQDYLGISPYDMVKNADITHKYGIRFENWSTHTPKYFHSIGGPIVQNFSSFIGYNYLLENDKLLTNSLSWRGLEDDNILKLKDEAGNDISHYGTNQYHFDTFKLNLFLRKIASDFGIFFVEGKIEDVKFDNNGFISCLSLEGHQNLIHGDFFVDCTGFARVLSSKFKNRHFNSFREYLPCDSALVFPTDLPDNGKIHPFTRAIAMNSGWMWEIPTQSRRGNGYVFSSDFCSEEQALKEAEEFHGIKIDNHRVINYKSGYYSEPWQKNCVSIGISYSFIEPLEATTISIGIQQAKLLCSYLPTFNKESRYLSREYNRVMQQVMENAVSMISLHYMSDREDTEMWKAQKLAKKPELLKRLLEIWSERTPEPVDIPTSGYELFGAAHLWHVAQGQGVLNKDVATVTLDAYGNRDVVRKTLIDTMRGYLTSEVIDHAEALRRTRDS